MRGPNPYLKQSLFEAWSKTYCLGRVQPSPGHLIASRMSDDFNAPSHQPTPKSLPPPPTPWGPFPSQEVSAATTTEHPQ